MKPNPALRKLGFADTDRVVIIHTDDIGMCGATLSGLADLWDAGIISSSAVMVPCPWFPALAEFCRQHPSVDMGVHLTLTSEWDSYRWGPISTRDPASGLIDEEGYFYRRSEEVQAHGDPDAVRLELQRQLDCALAAGIDVTHVDTHMGAVAHVRFVFSYIQLARQHQLPPMIARLDEAGWREVGLDAETAAFAVQAVQQLEAEGLPLLDGIASLPLDQPEGRLELAKRTLGSLPAGITHFIIHPAQDSPELRVITPSGWRSRVADYATFTSEELRRYIKHSGIQVIGYRALRKLMR